MPRRSVSDAADDEDYSSARAVTTMATTSGLAVNPASPSTMPAADLAKWTGFVDAPSQQRRKRRTAMAKQSTHGKRPRATFGCKHIKCDPTIRRAFERENLNIVKVCQLARKAGVVHFNPLLLDASGEFTQLTYATHTCNLLS